MFVFKLSGIQRLICSKKSWCEMFVLKLSGIQNTLYENVNGFAESNQEITCRQGLEFYPIQLLKGFPLSLI